MYKHSKNLLTYHTIADPQECIELEFRAIAKQKDIFSVLMTRVSAVGEVLCPLDHRFERRCKCFATARSQQGHPRCFDESFEMFQS